MQRITLKKDKRSEAEKILDDWIDGTADEVSSFEDANQLVDLMAKRKKLDEQNRLELPPAVWSGLFSVLGIGMILYHEKAEVITSKALGFVLKGRV